MPLDLHQLLCGCVREAAPANSGVRVGLQVRSLMAQLMDGLQYLHSQVSCALAESHSVHSAHHATASSLCTHAYQPGHHSTSTSGRGPA